MLRGSGSRSAEPRRLQAHRGRRTFGDPRARCRRRAERRRERLRPSRHAVLPRTSRQPQGVRLPVPPVELHAQGRPAGRAVPARRQAGRPGPRRHAGRLQDHRPRPEQAEGGHARGRRVRVVRPGRRVPGGLPRPHHPRLLRPPVQRPHAEDPRLQPAAHPGQLEAHAGEHQGPVPPRPAAHLVRDLRALARRQQVPAAHGRQASPRRDDQHARHGRQGPSR